MAFKRSHSSQLRQRARRERFLSAPSAVWSVQERVDATARCGKLANFPEAPIRVAAQWRAYSRLRRSTGSDGRQVEKEARKRRGEIAKRVKSLCDGVRTWHSTWTMSEQPRARKSVPIDPRDQSRIIAALERWAATEDFVALRTRAFVYLLWDGAVRTKAAVWLNAEEVVKDPAAARIHVVQEIAQRPCEGNNYRERKFLMSDRTRNALVDYLKAVRAGGWLAKGDRLQGPLWLSTHHHGSQQRMSQRTAMQAWRTFVEEVELSREYQLDDIVLTGRIAFLQAAKGSTDVLSQHVGISAKWAGQYREHLLTSPSSTTRDVISQLNKHQKRKHS